MSFTKIDVSCEVLERASEGDEGVRSRGVGISLG